MPAWKITHADGSVGYITSALAPLGDIVEELDPALLPAPPFVPDGAAWQALADAQTLGDVREAAAAAGGA